MSIFSMTGYASHAVETQAGAVTIELRSVNSRFLDLQFRINDDLRAAEPLLRDALNAKLARGKVECRLSFGRRAADGSQAVNETVLSSLAAMQEAARKRFPQAPPLTVNELLRWPGVIEESGFSQEALLEDIRKTMDTALKAFIESRRREGDALRAMLLTRVDGLQEIVERITPLVPQAVAQFQQKAIERMREATTLALQNNNGNSPADALPDEVMERIRQEVTLYGIRVDVSEELNRLSAHVAETRAILEKGGQVGKRLDFMMQELNREANTLGSKAAVKELSDASMQMKLLIEQMREQVQNLE